MFYSDDPITDYERYDAEYARLMARMPECKVCGQKIQSEMAYWILGEYICEHCIESARINMLEEFMEDW